MNRLKINVEETQQNLNEYIRLNKETEAQIIKLKAENGRLESKNRKLRDKLEQVNVEKNEPIEDLKEVNESNKLKSFINTKRSVSF